MRRSMSHPLAYFSGPNRRRFARVRTAALVALTAASFVTSLCLPLEISRRARAIAEHPTCVITPQLIATRARGPEKVIPWLPVTFGLTLVGGVLSIRSYYAAREGD